MPSQTTMPTKVVGWSSFLAGVVVTSAVWFATSSRSDSAELLQNSCGTSLGVEVSGGRAYGVATASNGHQVLKVTLHDNTTGEQVGTEMASPPNSVAQNEVTPNRDVFIKAYVVDEEGNGQDQVSARVAQLGVFDNNLIAVPTSRQPRSEAVRAALGGPTPTCLDSGSLSD